jgi:hypothetical protein
MLYYFSVTSFSEIVSFITVLYSLILSMQNDVDIVLPDNISEYNTVINETISEKEVTEK